MTTGNNETNNTTERIKGLLVAVSRSRGENRTRANEELIKGIRDYVAITGGVSRGILRGVVSSVYSGSRVRTVTGDIIGLLLDNGFKEDVVKTVKYGFYNKPMFSRDFSSYAVLMKAYKEGRVNGCITNDHKSVCRVALVSRSVIYRL